MSCCRPSACSGAMLVAGGYLAGARLSAIGWAMWVWIAILLVILALSMFTVTPPSPEQTGEPPP